MKTLSTAIVGGLVIAAVSLIGFCLLLQTYRIGREQERKMELAENQALAKTSLDAVQRSGLYSQKDVETLRQMADYYARQPK